MKTAVGAGTANLLFRVINLSNSSCSPVVANCLFVLKAVVVTVSYFLPLECPPTTHLFVVLTYKGKNSTGFEPQTPALSVQALAHYPTGCCWKKRQHLTSSLALALPYAFLEPAETHCPLP